MIHPGDPSDMYSMIANFPSQFAQGLVWAEHIRFSTPITRVIVSGMGGSALPTDLFNTTFESQLPQPILVNRTYTLPARQLDAGTLMIACSFSGNTEETIAAYEQAVAAGAQTVVIAGGGKLIDLAGDKGLPFVRLIKESPGFQPRMGSGYFFGVLTAVLVAANWLPAGSKDWIISEADKLKAFSAHDLGQSLVESLHKKIPVFYTPDHLWAVARVAKIKINENAKVPAFWSYLPEANHNEMVGFSRPTGDFVAVMFKDPDADSRVNLRFDITAKVLLETSHISTIALDMWGDSIFTKVFSTLMTIDWASYYLALKDEVDPTPVAMVEDFKKAIEAQQLAK